MKKFVVMLLLLTFIGSFLQASITSKEAAKRILNWEKYSKYELMEVIDFMSQELAREQVENDINDAIKKESTILFIPKNLLMGFALGLAIGVMNNGN